MARLIPRRAQLPPGTVSTLAAAKVAGLHWRTLLRWIERGALDPELYIGERGTQGAGFAWRLHDVTAARTIAELRAAGLSAQKIRLAAAALQRHGGRPFHAVRLWTDGREAFEVLPERRLMALALKQGQFQVFALDDWAATVAREFRAELRRRDAA